MTGSRGLRDPVGGGRGRAAAAGFFPSRGRDAEDAATGGAAAGIVVVTVTYDVSLDSVVACPVWSGGKNNPQ
jgi:hypothetical protein